MKKRRTSLYLSGETMIELQNISKQMKVSIDSLIVIVLKFYINKKKFEKVKKRNISYQKKRGKNHYSSENFYFSEEDAALFYDARNIFRISVSRMLAEGVLLFLEKLNSKNIKELYSYADLKRSLSKTVKKTQIFYIIQWQIKRE